MALAETQRIRSVTALWTGWPLYGDDAVDTTRSSPWRRRSGAGGLRHRGQLLVEPIGGDRGHLGLSGLDRLEFATSAEKDELESVTVKVLPVGPGERQGPRGDDYRRKGCSLDMFVSGKLRYACAR